MADNELKPHMAAISSIATRFPNEDDAAPELRKLAVKFKLRRHKVFSAYRLIKQQRETGE